VVILVAAGTGERLGASVPKAFVSIGGRPLLAHALDGIAASSEVGSLIVVVPPGAEADARAVVAEIAGPPLEGVVAGGATRQESVRLGLRAVGSGADVALIHDAARPFARPEVFRRVVAALSAADHAEGAIPVVPSPDTVKLVRDGFVTETVPRAQLGLVQTPQGFRLDVLRRVHADPPMGMEDATDDALLLELAGYRVAAVEGDPANFKITTPEDLRRAEEYLRQRAEAGRA
jgi:2-C-methyl-D-erythritol 4-phosphate cytidylyltransferase